MLLHGAKAQVRTAAACNGCHAQLLALLCTAAAWCLVVNNMRAHENTICTPLATAGCCALAVVAARALENGKLWALHV